MAEGTGTLSAPGRYLVICTIAVRADPAAILTRSGLPERSATNPPHFIRGMFAELSVG